MEDLELNKRVEEEARKARARYRDRAAFAGSSPSSESACWIETVRPLVERIVELEGAPANVDAPQGETLIKRVGREVGPALDRWQACNDGNHSSMRAAIGPLVATIMGLEDERANLNREIAFLRADLTATRDAGQAYADKLTAVQRAKTDQAIEIDRLKGELIDLNNERNEAQRAAKRCADEAREMRFELEKQTKRADDADDEITDLRTTVRVIVGMIAPRGQS